MPGRITRKSEDFRTFLGIYLFVLAGKPTDTDKYIITYNNLKFNIRKLLFFVDLKLFFMETVRFLCNDFCRCTEYVVFAKKSLKISVFL